METRKEKPALVVRLVEKAKGLDLRRNDINQIKEDLCEKGFVDLCWDFF